MSLGLLAALALQAASLTGSPDDLRFAHLSVADGISHSWVHAILKDRRGFMWFGTSGGLDRYDGSSFRHFKPEPADPARMASRAIMAMLLDSRGRMWVGGGGGLSLYDAGTERFTTYLVTERADREVENDVRALLEDREGRLWVATVARLHEFDPATGTFRAVETGPSWNTQWPALLEDREGRLWVGSASGLRRYDRTRRAAVAVPRLAGDEVADLRQEPGGTLWAATLGHGLCRVNPRTLQIESYLPEPGNPASLSTRRVRTLGTGPDGRLYVGTENGGLDVLDPRTGTFTHNLMDREDESSIGGNSIWAIYTDDEGILWIGTYGGGVSYATPQGQGLAQIRARRGGLSDPHVSAIVQSHDGILWIGTDGGGLNRLDPRTGRVTYLRNDPADPASLPSDSVWALFEDSHRRLWVGMWAGGLCRLDGARRFTCYRHDPADPTSLAEDNVWGISEDPNGELIIALNDSGPDVFDPRAGTFSRLSSRFPALHATGSPAVAHDHRGGLWVGSYRNVEYLDRRTGAVTTYVNDPGHPRSIAAGFVQQIYVDSRENVWLALEDGLDCIEATTRRIHHYTVADGLPHDTVNAVLEDGGGNLWLSTLRGLSKLEDAVRLPSRPRFLNLGAKEGAQDAEFLKRSAFRAPNGEMFFGGSNGLNAFFPEAARPNEHVPPVVLTDVFLFNRRVVPGAPGSPLARAATETRELTLSYRQSVVGFEIAVLDYVAPSKNRLAYKLEGFDADWSESGPERRVTYTNLPAGRYVLRVRGSNNDGVWNTEGVSLAVRVTPPFWKAPWFVALCGVAAIVGIAVGHRVRVLQVTAREREVARRVEESLAADIRVLRGLLPVCAWCKQVRDDRGYWTQMEVYIREHSLADFSHGICPDCARAMKAGAGGQEPLGDRGPRPKLASPRG